MFSVFRPLRPMLQAGPDYGDQDQVHSLVLARRSAVGIRADCLPEGSGASVQFPLVLLGVILSPVCPEAGWPSLTRRDLGLRMGLCLNVIISGRFRTL